MEKSSLQDGKRKFNAGFAIIHDKVLVIDPFSEDCVVVREATTRS